VTLQCSAKLEPKTSSRTGGFCSVTDLGRIDTDCSDQIRALEQLPSSMCEPNLGDLESLELIFHMTLCRLMNPYSKSRSFFLFRHTLPRFPNSWTFIKNRLNFMYSMNFRRTQTWLDNVSKLEIYRNVRTGWNLIRHHVNFIFYRCSLCSWTNEKQGKLSSMNLPRKPKRRSGHHFHC